MNRLLHAHGVALSALGVAQGELSEQQSREAFRIVCAHWSVYRGTPVRLWFDAQLADIFGVTVRPSAETADQIYDQIAARLAPPEFRPARCTTGSASRCWPPPTTRATTCRPTSACATIRPGTGG